MRRAASESRLRVAGGTHRVEVERRPDAGRRDRRAQRLQRVAVAEQQVVGGVRGTGADGAAGGVVPAAVAEERRAPRLVQGDPVRDHVAELLGDDGGVVGEPARGVAVEPAAAILQRLRQVPVVQRRPRGDALLEQRLRQAAVEVEAGAVGRSGAVGLDARPRDREPVRVEAEVGHQRDVLRPAVIVVVGDVAGAAVGDRAGDAGERVPDALAAPVLPGGAFDLVGGRRGSDDEAVGKVASLHGHCSLDGASQSPSPFS